MGGGSGSADLAEKREVVCVLVTRCAWWGSLEHEGFRILAKSVTRMAPAMHLCLVLHNHQPVGNFDGVFEQAYQDSYLPFLDVFEPYSALRISLHTSGPLMEWLAERHPEYLDRLAKLVEAGRVEIVGGAFYEPILTMIPSRDRISQITSYSRWLGHRLGARIQGMWMPERVWEQTLTSDLARSEIRYTVLDDCHFRNAGLTDEQLHGHFVTEDDGHLLGLFPGSERLRYLIPFRPVEETIDFLRGWSERQRGAVAVFGDDGEKFGTWPDTKRHVYEEGWLRCFFDALTRESSWLNTCTLAEAHSQTASAGRVYVPDGSYREMTEWALPVERQLALDHLVHELEHHESWPALKSFLRGGFWRNFKAKYPESNEMYARMMYVSSLLQQAEQEGFDDGILAAARRELHRGQCNCSYWHGAFGGIYLPHLRNAVYRHLLLAENVIEGIGAEREPFVEATADDYDFDGEAEVRLSNDRLVAWLDPTLGGRLYELDVRSIGLNLQATIARRPEAYHDKIRRGPTGNQGEVASIHDRVVFKQPDLDRKLTYDRDLRKSLIDRFLDSGTDLGAVAEERFEDRGDFARGSYAARVRRAARRIQVQLRREGSAYGRPLVITKGVTIDAGSDTLEIAYLLEGVPRDADWNFAVEFNFAALPAGADDRRFHHADQRDLGHLGTRLDLNGVTDLGLVDRWLGIDVKWTANRPTDVWTFPLETVSQSEGGFEAVHQSVVMMPHWQIRGDSHGRWSVTMRIQTDTSLAESRRSELTGSLSAG